MDKFDLTPEEEEEMRICFWEIVKKQKYNFHVRKKCE